MSTEFKKESRYIVLKLSRMSVHAQTKIGATLAEIDLIQDIQDFIPECVVVESDWPNYNETWETIKDITQNAFISRDELAKENETLKDWRRLALQFDGHRMQAMSMLKLVASGNFDIEEVKKFVAAAPISGNTHLREIRAESFDAGYHYGLTCHELNHPAKNIEDVISQYLDNIGGTKYTAMTEKLKLKVLQCNLCKNTLDESDMVGIWKNVCPVCDSANSCNPIENCME